ncbi:hypothetical protein D3C79_907420 [compost metagenome]
MSENKAGEDRYHYDGCSDDDTAGLIVSVYNTFRSVMPMDVRLAHGADEEHLIIHR